MNQDDVLRKEFYDKFTVWNQKYKFADKPHKPFADPEEWTPVDVADYWLNVLHSRDTAIREELLGKMGLLEKPEVADESEVAYLTRANYNLAIDKAKFIITEVLNKNK